MSNSTISKNSDAILDIANELKSLYSKDNKDSDKIILFLGYSLLRVDSIFKISSLLLTTSQNLPADSEKRICIKSNIEGTINKNIILDELLYKNFRLYSEIQPANTYKAYMAILEKFISITKSNRNITNNDLYKYVSEVVISTYVIIKDSSIVGYYNE